MMSFSWPEEDLVCRRDLGRVELTFNHIIVRLANWCHIGKTVIENRMYVELVRLIDLG
jgi:hypothetical protein